MDKRDRLIRITWGKASLYFTLTEIRRAVQRGKAIKRHETLRQRGQGFDKPLLPSKQVDITRTKRLM